MTVGLLDCGTVALNWLLLFALSQTCCRQTSAFCHRPVSSLHLSFSRMINKDLELLEKKEQSIPLGFSAPTNLVSLNPL
jgi:hypothetical protein